MKVLKAKEGKEDTVVKRFVVWSRALSSSATTGLGSEGRRGGPTVPRGKVRTVDNAHRMTKDDNRRSVLGAAAFERVGDGPGSRAGWDPPWMVRPKKGGDLVEEFSRGYAEVAFS
jgi:hypothetical protein